MRIKRIRIEVPQLPPTPLSPNWRGHWGKKYRAASGPRGYRNSVFYCCIDIKNSVDPRGKNFPFVKAELEITLIFSSIRRRDMDNALASFKPGVDAMVGAGLIVDDNAAHLKVSNVVLVVDPTRSPMTIIELREVKNV